MTPFIETSTGVRFCPLDPRPEDVRLEDIAHHLANQCRFSGATRVHYSVAEHSVRVAELVESWGCPPETVLWALLHDASEAYLVDLPSPLKEDSTIGQAYRRAEARLMRVIGDVFGLPDGQPYAVRLADLVLLATEARDLMPFGPAHWGRLECAALDERIEPWSASLAEVKFTMMFHRITTGPASEDEHCPATQPSVDPDRPVPFVPTACSVETNSPKLSDWAILGAPSKAQVGEPCPETQPSVDPDRPVPFVPACGVRCDVETDEHKGCNYAVGEVRQVDPKTGGEKGVKEERYDLLPWDAMDEVARVYGFGAKKYADDNWLRGYPWRWSLGAMARHLSRILQGEDRDKESGLLHAAHIAWHALTILTFTLRRLGTDNRRGP